MSCNDKDTVVINPDNDVRTEDVRRVLNDASKEWGLGRDALIAGMSSYQLVNGTGNDMLQFCISENGQNISYLLKDGALCGTAIILPVKSADLELSSVLEGYNYVGELNEAKVYENLNTNTMAAIWAPVETNNSYCAIGFAPIKSDAYEKIEPIAVTINKDAEPEAITCTLHGSVANVNKEVEVGFFYSSKSIPSESYGRKVNTTSKGDFSLTLKGILDDQTYYYRAYALVDDVYYLSDVKEFTTEQLTYELDGVTYKFVKVEGGGMPPFSIMQTEYPCIGSHTVKILGQEYGSIDGRTGFGNGDGTVIITEFRSFWINFRASMHRLPVRLPHRDEWMYAASGGSKSNGYTYSGGNAIDNVAWYQANSGGEGHPVALKQPNELGLYDMSGNYAELCFKEGNLTGSQNDTVYIDGPYCGGSWNDPADKCKVTYWEEGKLGGTVAGTKISEKDAINSSIIGLRLVYSRSDE